MLRPLAEAHLTQDLQYPLLALRLGHVEVFQLQIDILLHRQLINQVEALEDKADASLAVVGARPLFQVPHLLAV